MWLLPLVIVWACLGVMAYLLKKGFEFWLVLEWLIFPVLFFGGWIWIERGGNLPWDTSLYLFCYLYHTSINWLGQIYGKDNDKG